MLKQVVIKIHETQYASRQFTITILNSFATILKLLYCLQTARSCIADLSKAFSKAFYRLAQFISLCRQNEVKPINDKTPVLKRVGKSPTVHQNTSYSDVRSILCIQYDYRFEQLSQTGVPTPKNQYLNRKCLSRVLHQLFY